MDDRQKYLFDLQGFLLIENVLSDEECEAAKRKIDGKKKPMEKTPDGYPANGMWFAAGGLFDEGEPFIKLIDHPKITDVLRDIIAPKLRLETAYSFVRLKGCPQFEMHGGSAGGDVHFRYYVRGNRIYTGLTVVSIALQDIDERDGGFACIPGSHKSEFPVPREDLKELYAHGGPLVRTIATPKGSAVIFTEALAHGAASWQGKEPRYGLFYKYNDRSAAYQDLGQARPSAKALAAMSDEQKCYFNTVFEAFGPADNFATTKPNFAG